MLTSSSTQLIYNFCYLLYLTAVKLFTWFQKNDGWDLYQLISL